MRRVALKGLAWRKIRGVLTALAIVLGVAMVSGAFILTDTMKKAADNLEASSYAGIDGIVTGVASFRDDNSWQKTPSISQSSSRGRGACRRSATRRRLGPRPGEARERQGRGDRRSRRTSRVGIDASRPGADRVNPLTLGAGRWATGPDEVAIDAGTAEARASRASATPSASSRPARAQVQDRRARQVRERRLARRGDGRRVRPEDGAGAVRQARRGRPGRRSRQGRASRRGRARGGRAARSQARRRRCRRRRRPTRSTSRVSRASSRSSRSSCSRSPASRSSSARSSSSTRSRSPSRNGRVSSRCCGRSARRAGRCCARSCSRRSSSVSRRRSSAPRSALLIAKFLNAVMKAAEIDLPQAGTVFSLRTVLVSLLVGVVVTVLAEHHPGGARDPRRAGGRAPRGLDDAEVAVVARNAVHRDRLGSRRLRRCSCSGCSGTAAARGVHVLTIAGGTLGAVHRRRAARASPRPSDRVGGRRSGGSLRGRTRTARPRERDAQSRAARPSLLRR